MMLCILRIRLCLFCSFAWRLGPGQVYETSVGRPPHGRWTTDGPGRATAPPGPPPIASTFGDTDSEFFGLKIFRPNVASTTIDAEVFFFEMVLGWSGGLKPPQEIPWEGLGFAPRKFRRPSVRQTLNSRTLVPV